MNNNLPPNMQYNNQGNIPNQNGYANKERIWNNPKNAIGTRKKC